MKRAMYPSLRYSVLTAFTLLIAACALQEQPPVVYTPPPEPEPQVAPPVPVGPSAEVPRRRMIRDALYAARAAYDAHRLMVPAGANAYDRYREVLSYDPGNAVAQQGVRDIALRYVQLAGNAMGIGEFDNDAALL